jgi:hypothetical protein
MPPHQAVQAPESPPGRLDVLLGSKTFGQRDDALILPGKGPGDLLGLLGHALQGFVPQDSRIAS